MTTSTSERIQLQAAALSEALWLSVLVLVPLVAGPFSHIPYDPDKSRLLLALAPLLAGVVAVRGWTGGRCGRSDLARLLLIAAGLWFGVRLLSAATSIDASLSFGGGHGRLQGIAVEGCYVLLFLATALGLRHRRQAERLLRTLVLVGTLAAAYALCQIIDPAATGLTAGSRPVSTLGNPIFLAALLALTLPATAGLIGSTPIWRNRLVYGSAAAIQMLALLAAASRGPLLGVIAAGTVLLVGWRRTVRPAMPAPRPDGAGAGRLPGRLRAVASLLLLAALAFAVLIAGGFEHTSRLGRVFELGRGTALVRVLGWNAVSRALIDAQGGAASLSDPRPGARMALGYGPETLALMVNPRLDMELERTNPNRQLDRAHNDGMQALAESGAAGLVCWILLWSALLVAALRASGVRVGLEDARLLVGAALIGLLATAALSRSLAFCGLGAGLGLVVGVLALMLTRRVSPPGQSWMRLGLLALLVGHLVELQSGIGVTATRVVFWIVAGALASRWAEAGDEPASGEESEPAVPGLLPGLLAAVALATIAHGLLRVVPGDPWPRVPLVEPVWWPAAVTLLVSVVVAGWLQVAEWRPGTSIRARVPSCLAPLAAVGAISLIAALPRWLAPAPGAPASAVVLSDRLVFGCLLVVPALIAPVLPGRWNRHGRGPAAALVVTVVFAAAVPQLVPVHTARASEVHAGLAGALVRSGQMEAGAAGFRRALAIGDGAEHQRDLAEALVASALARADGSLASEAVVAARRSVESAPLDPSMHLVLARSLMAQARLGTGEARTAALVAASEAATRAYELRPTAASVRLELARIRSALAADGSNP